MSYRVVVTREGEHWLADVPELEGAHTFARTLTGLDRAVREVVVLAADLPDEAIETVELEWDIHTGDPELDAAAAAARRARAEKDEAERRAAKATERALHRLEATRQGMSRRDLGLLLGLSHQRVQQIASAHDRVHSD